MKKIVIKIPRVKPRNPIAKAAVNRRSGATGEDRKRRPALDRLADADECDLCELDDCDGCLSGPHPKK